MARLYLVNRPGSLMNALYLIDEAVGKGCPNRTDDVALVQFFLRAIMEDAKIYTLPPSGKLSIDGIYGPQTQEHITSWQQQEGKLADQPLKPFEDGQISPVLHRAFTGSRSHSRYAILSFNVIYAGVNGADKHAKLGSDQRCPTALLPSIFWP